MHRIILISAGLLGCALLLDSLLLEAFALGGAIKIVTPLALAALDYAVLLWPAVAMAGALWWLLRGNPHRLSSWLNLPRDLAMRLRAIDLPTVRRADGYGPLLA